jgi:hypothetical protein
MDKKGYIDNIKLVLCLYFAILITYVSWLFTNPTKDVWFIGISGGIFIAIFALLLRMLKPIETEETT